MPFGHYKRKIVVALLPGDVLSMRLERTPARLAYTAEIDDVFRTLAQWHAAAEVRRRREARKQKRLTEIS